MEQSELPRGPSMDVSHFESILGTAIRTGYVRDREPAVLFHDLGRMVAKLRELQRCFPRDTLHALAIKANPLVEILRCAVQAGAGLEAASLEEVHLALAAGCNPRRILYDSPAKSIDDLRQALTLGVWINADNLEELSRIATLQRQGPWRNGVGLRINPLVGLGTIPITSVAGPASRFGVPCDQAKQELPSILERFPWLSGLHVHVGSQGISIDQWIRGIRKTVELAESIPSSPSGKGISVIDLGGGLPVAYTEEIAVPSFGDFVAGLRAQVPSLFQGRFRLMTEFGRVVQASCGWAASRVEYVKQVGNQTVAIIHLGADFLLRAAYQPDTWKHRISILDLRGQRKNAPVRPTTIAGPLCFAGDVVAHNVQLPEVAVGDWVVIHDVGAYCLGLWSRHCSRSMPRVLGYDTAQPNMIQVLREAETPADVVRFWSQGFPEPNQPRAKPRAGVRSGAVTSPIQQARTNEKPDWPRDPKENSSGIGTQIKETNYYDQEYQSI